MTWFWTSDLLPELIKEDQNENKENMQPEVRHAETSTKTAISTTSTQSMVRHSLLPSYDKKTSSPTQRGEKSARLSVTHIASLLKF